MDPKDSRPRSPSLLDGGDTAARPEPPRPAAIAPAWPDAEPAESAAPNPGPRWLWPLAVALLGVTALLLLHMGGAFETGPATVAASPASAPSTGAEPAPTARETLAAADARARRAAIILPASDADAVPAVAASTPAVAADPERDELSRLFAPNPPPAPAPRPVRRAATGGDADVTLLTALIHHVEAESAATRKARRAAEEAANAPGPDAIEARMQTCPAANTEAGVACRQKLCAGNEGKTSACPAGSAGA